MNPPRLFAVRISSALVALAVACSGTPKCGPSNCPTGCCDSNGLCVFGNVQSACGAGGGSCAFCSGTQSCQLGLCANPGSGSCTASNCAGCCSGNTCVPQAQETTVSCGVTSAAGAACTQCSGTQSCAGGTCQTNDGGGCNAANCTNGCCEGNTCVPLAQESTARCGTTAAPGAACTQCTGTQSCTGGTCQASDGGTLCDASNCAGCCVGSTCVPTSAETTGQCGATLTPGQACVACGFGQSCTGGVCVGGPDGGASCTSAVSCGGQVCCANVSDAGVFPGCAGTCSTADTLNCDRPQQCTGSLCCGRATFSGGGVPPACAFATLGSACQASCPTVVQITSCTGFDQVNLCKVTSDCTDPTYNTCCEFNLGNGVLLTFCADSLLKTGAVQCF